jgi:hypothetical protein
LWNKIFFSVNFVFKLKTRAEIRQNSFFLIFLEKISQKSIKKSLKKASGGLKKWFSFVQNPYPTRGNFTEIQSSSLKQRGRILMKNPVLVLVSQMCQHIKQVIINVIFTTISSYATHVVQGNLRIVVLAVLATTLITHNCNLVQ